LILLTVGSQLPFNRLVRAVDEWAARTPEAEIFAQIGGGGIEAYEPKHMEWAPYVDPEDFDKLFRSSEFVIAHAGMGSIISALSFRKSIVVMPRRASLGEHRNEHQLHTAKHFAQRAGIHVAMEESELAEAIDAQMKNSRAPDSAVELPEFADESLIGRLESFIHGTKLI